MKDKWLFSTIGKRGYIADYFRQADPNIHIIGSGNSQFTAGFIACDASVRLPDIQSDLYLDAVRKLVAANQINAILSFTDPDVAALSSIREELSSQGVSCFFPGAGLAMMAYDKLQTAHWAQQHNYKTPKTAATPQQAITEIGFPILRKPRFGSASVGVSIAHSPQELFPAPNDPTPYIYQEFIAGEEFNVEICGDLAGRTMSVSAWRKVLSRNGETELALTIRRPDLIDLACSFGRQAKIIGPCDVDLIYHNGNFYLIEFNMRFGGGYPVSHLAGAKFPELLLQAHHGEQPSLHTDFQGEIFMMKALQPLGGRLSEADQIFPGSQSYRRLD